jgi:hypothetical protein
VARRPTITTIKTLFALSHNVCALPGCDEPSTKPQWVEVNADIAHIEGEREGAARWNKGMTDEERRAFPNLMLLCPGCHRLIDRLEPEEWTVERLREIKTHHESSGVAVATGARAWATDDMLTRYADMLLAVLPGRSMPLIESGFDSGGNLVLRSVGDRAALNIRLDSSPLFSIEKLPVLLSGRLEPNTIWLVPSETIDVGPPLVVIWEDADGNEFDTVVVPFPI